MALDSTKVIVPGHGHYYVAAVDSLPPGQVVAFTGAPTAVTSLVLTVNSVSTSGLVLAALTTAAQGANCLLIAQALANLSTVGAGKVAVMPGSTGSQFLVIIDPSVTTQVITSSGSTFTGGTGPAVTVTSRATWSSWTEVGHTSSDSPMQVNVSGGDVTTVGSWQQDSIDSSTAPVTRSLAFSLLQHDLTNYKLYYGSGVSLQSSDGQLLIPQTSGTATEQALFLYILNGSKYQPRFYPRVSIIGADGENFDTSKLDELPTQATILSSNTLTYQAGMSPVGAFA